MRSISLKRIANATGGAVTGDPRAVVSGVGTDTRDLRPKELFVALKGERHDGHMFLAEAFEAGAAAALVERGNAYSEKCSKKRRGIQLVEVADTTKALGDLAYSVREGFDLTAIGITGSTGKTCVKDFLVSILKKSYRVAFTPGNYNNEIGVPLSIFSVKPKDDVIVAELGARHLGDIKRLTEIVRPSVGIITNVGVTHLEILKSPRIVAKTKAELASALPPDGLLVLNSENGWSSFMQGRTEARVVKFGFSRGAEYRAAGISLDEAGRPGFTVNGPEFSLELRLKTVGRHQVANALAAVACASEMGLEPDVIAEGLKDANLSPWRMEVLESPAGLIVINDAYNANPQSMKAALEALGSMGKGRRSIAVLGIMAELGSESSRYHREIGKYAAKLDTDILFTVGRKARDYAVGAFEAGMPKGSVFRCSEREEALDLLKDVVEPTDVILVKGSRVVGMEKVAQRLGEPGFIRTRRVANV